ncbi:MAG TPA: tRNA (N6-threonylcarbamoyladenosine(37)-N6)-methyltransferase TrmO [Mycobacteriales bacterium]|jgi:tRNA-Thr(GGU) m(6)t(6)A37 methyltransferase TsaA
MSATSYTVRPIGLVESPLVDRESAPRQGDEGTPDAWIAVDHEFREAMRDLTAGADVIVLTWLDRADRGVLSVHPRSDPDRPLQGVFTTRSPDRPNPIGLHRVRILDVEATRIQVEGLEALDRTPVLDIKPALGPVDDR